MTFPASATTYLNPLNWAHAAWSYKKTTLVCASIGGVVYPLLFSPYVSYRFSNETENQFEWIGPKGGAAPGVNDEPREFDGEDYRGFFTLLFHRYLANYRDFRSEARKHYEQFLESVGHPSETYTAPTQPLEKFHENSEGLYLFVHGLKGHASAWNGYKTAIEQKEGQADVRLIKVLNGGDCAVNDAAEQINTIIDAYLKEHPNKPIALVGTSRGGPIVAELELRLRASAPDTPVFVGTIAGANGGTLMMNLLNAIPIVNRLYGKAVIDELSYKSGKVQELQGRQGTSVPQNRTYVNYCTTEEFQIQPCTGFFQSHHNNYYMHGWGHISIVEGVQNHLLGKIETWKVSLIS